MTHRQHQIGIAATILVVLGTARAAADPAPPPPAQTLILKRCAEPDATCLHTISNSTLYTDTNEDYPLRLPPVYILDETTWGSLDFEVKRLQESETRLKAENKSLRSATTSWQPGWLTLAGTLVGGVTLGWILHEKL